MSVEAPAPAADDAMEGIIETSAANDTTATPPAPAAPEIVVSETLYIQNLNEKIKTDSECENDDKNIDQRV